MIKIKHNNEVYEITYVGRYGEAEVACVDYTAGICEHVQSIIEVLAACNADYELEEL